MKLEGTEDLSMEFDVSIQGLLIISRRFQEHVNHGSACLEAALGSADEGRRDGGEDRSMERTKRRCNEPESEADPRGVLPAGPAVEADRLWRGPGTFRQS